MAEGRKAEVRKDLLAFLCLVLLIVTSACGTTPPESSVEPEPGISQALAVERAAAIGNLRYDLSFDIPVDPAAPIEARVRLRFSLKRVDRPLVLDFGPGQTHVKSVASGGRTVAPLVSNGHIAIPARELTAGENDLVVTFRA